MSKRPSSTELYARSCKNIREDISTKTKKDDQAKQETARIVLEGLDRAFADETLKLPLLIPLHKFNAVAWPESMKFDPRTVSDVACAVLDEHYNAGDNLLCAGMVDCYSDRGNSIVIKQKAIAPKQECHT